MICKNILCLIEIDFGKYGIVTYKSSFHLNNVHLGVLLSEILGNRAARNTLLKRFKRSSWIDLSACNHTYF